MLGPEKVLVGRAKIRDRIQVIHPGGVEKPRQIDRMLGCVHGDLYDPVGHAEDRPLGIPPWPAQ